MLLQIQLLSLLDHPLLCYVFIAVQIKDFLRGVEGLNELLHLVLILRVVFYYEPRVAGLPEHQVQQPLCEFVVITDFDFPSVLVLVVLEVIQVDVLYVVFVRRLLANFCLSYGLRADAEINLGL